MDLWRHLSDGLALFAAPKLFRTYRLLLNLDERLIVAERYLLAEGLVASPNALTAGALHAAAWAIV